MCGKRSCWRRASYFSGTAASIRLRRPRSFLRLTARKHAPSWPRWKPSGGRKMNQRLASEILQLSLEHLWLVLISIVVAAAVAVPGAIALTRRAALRGWLLGFASVMQTIPSLALFGFL